MKTILVATDFSPAASNAVNYAADMALVIKADLLLLHTIQVPVSYGEIAVTVNMDEIEKAARKDLVEIKNQLNKKSNDKLNILTEVRIGALFTELEIICERIKPYAVVMGSQGTTAAERFFFGGHTVHATKNLNWPLITVPPTVSFSAVKKIGLACDLDKVVDTIPLDEIKLLVNDFNAELHILNTAKEETFNADIVFESGLLQEMLVALKPVYHFISNKDIDAGIIDFADKNNIGLLIVLPKRHGLLDKLVHKSHTKQLVLHSHVPVMALHQ